jgi:hypothetical protein
MLNTAAGEEATVRLVLDLRREIEETYDVLSGYK